MQADWARCCDVVCPKRKTCARWRNRHDPKARIFMSLHGRDPGIPCEAYIPDGPADGGKEVKDGDA